MWNGVWKLTVMVGVVGIGLFAVFQAQKGMNRSASVSWTDDTDEASQEPTEEDNVVNTGALSEPLLLSVNQKDSLKPAKQTTRTASVDRIDLVNNNSPEPTKVKTALGTAESSSGKFALASRDTRRVGLSFQDDEAEEPFDSLDDAPAAAAPQALPLEIPDGEITDTKASKAEAAATESNPLPEDGQPEITEDPFDASSAPPLAEQKLDAPSPPAKSAKDAPLVAPGFGDDDIPRSRRGMQNTDRKATVPAQDESVATEDEGTKETGSKEEVKSEDDADLFETETKPMAAPPAADPDFDFSDSPAAPVVSEDPAEKSNDDLTAKEADEQPALPERTEEPQPFEVQEQPEPAAEPASIPAVKESKQPAKLPAPSDSETVPARSQAARNRHRVPAETDSDLDEIETRPSRNRERPKPQPENDSLTANDMIGDGVAGDETQRGVQQPRLTIEKVAQQQAILNQPLVYTIIVRNTGDVAAHNIVIEDRIPKGTELLGTAPRAELVGKTLTWKAEILRPNEQKRISIQVVPKQEGPIGSVARVHFATEVSAEIQVAAPQLEFHVNAPAEVRLGQNFDLVFQLKNVGKVEAANIIVRDIVPDHLKHETGSDIECPIGKLAPNEVREIVLPVVAAKLGTGSNRAVLTADGGIQKELESAIHVVGEQLVLTRTGHNRVYVERPATFTNNIRNDGNLKVAQVRVSEVVPAGMEFESASDGGRFDSAKNAVVWTLGALAPGDDRAITVKYIPKETGTLNGKVTATAATGGSAVVNSTVEVVGRPELQMETLSATGLVTVGDKITSRFQLKNMGTATAKNVQLKIQLPPELRLVNVKGTKFQRTKNNAVIFDSIDELDPKTNAAFELVLEPIEEADARMSIEITADHLTKPHRREESIQIARDALK